MKDQNIPKYSKKELNLKFKTDKKTRNYFISLPGNKPSGSQENIICEIELIIDFGGQVKTKYNRIFILAL